MAKLIFIGEKFGDRVYELAAEKTTVGRGDFNTLTIHDGSVSQSHCEILVHGPEIIVRDLGSRNGTVVNGERLHGQQRPLKAGQIVKFGLVEARLELEWSPGSDTATGVTAIHSHVRHLQGQQSESKQPATFPTSLKSSQETDPAEHTMMLPGSPQPPASAARSELANGQTSRKPASRAVFTLIIAALVTGLVVLLWIVRGRQ
jgi:pSer/pThr/pTyr-binding forkhead associated (FHA) protein